MLHLENPSHGRQLQRRRKVPEARRDHGPPARARRLSLGSRADLRLHQALHAGRNLRGAGRHRPPRLERPGRRAGRLHAAGGLLRADGRRAGLLRHRRCARRHQSQAGPPPSARVRRRKRRADRGRRQAHLGRDERPRRKQSKGEAPSRPAGLRAARHAGAGGGAADRVARRRRGLRLGKCRAGDRQAATKSWPNSPRRAARASHDEHRGRTGRHAVRAGEPGALRESGSRAGAARAPTPSSARASATSSAAGGTRAKRWKIPTSTKWRSCGRRPSE